MELAGGALPRSRRSGGRSLMRNPTVTQRGALALTVYMLSQWNRDVPESYLAPDKIEQKYRALHPVPSDRRAGLPAVLHRLPRQWDVQPLGQEIQSLCSRHSRGFAGHHGESGIPAGQHRAGSPGHADARLGAPCRRTASARDHGGHRVSAQRGSRGTDHADGDCRQATPPAGSRCSRETATAVTA